MRQKKKATRLDWLARRLDASPKGYALLFVFSLLETTVVPVAIELALIPYMLINRRQALTIASVALAGSLAGALLGYAVGAGVMDTAGRYLVERFGWEEPFQQFVSDIDAYGFWAVFTIALSPVPFQIAQLGAGATGYSLPLFCLATVLARGLRFYSLAFLVLLFGDQAETLWQRYRRETVIATLILVLLLVVAVFLFG